MIKKKVFINYSTHVNFYLIIKINKYRKLCGRQKSFRNIPFEILMTISFGPNMRFDEKLKL